MEYKAVRHQSPNPAPLPSHYPTRPMRPIHRYDSFRFFCPILTFTWLAVVLAAAAVRADGLISNGQANRHGLVRAWFAVADVDPSRGRLVSVFKNDFVSKEELSSASAIATA